VPGKAVIVSLIRLVLRLEGVAMSLHIYTRGSNYLSETELLWVGFVDLEEAAKNVF